jgi:aldose 1-epimerase
MSLLAQLTLVSPDHRVRALVDLAGGRLRSLVVDQLELLVTEGAKPSRFGSFPMVPWCGRLAHGRLVFEGRAHDFPLTSPPHANHGRGYLTSWSAVIATDVHLTLRCDLALPWPFGGHVIERFHLSDEELVVTLEVHADEQPMPVMAGWHPWFQRRLERGDTARLEFEARSAYECDADQLPTGKLVAPPPAPWDHCFVGVARPPRIVWPRSVGARAFVLELRSTFDHWVVFTEPEHALCVEPQSGPPNQVNVAPILATPGRPLVGSMTYRWSTTA